MRTYQPVAAGLCTLLLLTSFHAVAVAQLTADQLLAPAVEKPSEYPAVEEAVAAFKAGKFSAAREELAAACKKHPQLAPPDMMLANLYLSVGQTQNATAAMDRAATQYPKDPEAYILAADLGLRNNQLTVAELGYEKGRQLIENAAGNPHRQKNLKIRIAAGSASLYEARENYTKAAELLNEWLKLDPSSPVAWGSLGRVQFHAKNYAEAKLSFGRMNQVSPSAAPAEIAMGRLYSSAGMHQEARQSMEAAASKAGKDNRARLTVAEWALEQGLTDLAKSQIDAALKNEDRLPEVHVLAARIARQAGDYDRAEKTLVQAVLRWPNDFSVTNELARALSASKDKEKLRTGLDYARRNFQMYSKQLQTPVGREATMTFAWLLHCNGRAAEAEAAFQTLADGSAISNENAYYAGKILANGGKEKLAVSALQAALAGNIQFPGKADAEKLLAALNKQPQ